jgi:hypothetical protein
LRVHDMRASKTYRDIRQKAQTSHSLLVPDFSHSAPLASNLTDYATVVFAVDGPEPGLKALIFRPFFRGMNPPAPSEKDIYNCSTRS